MATAGASYPGRQHSAPCSSLTIPARRCCRDYPGLVHFPVDPGQILPGPSYPLDGRPSVRWRTKRTDVAVRAVEAEVPNLERLTIQPEPELLPHALARLVNSRARMAIREFVYRSAGIYRNRPGSIAAFLPISPVNEFLDRN